MPVEGAGRGNNQGIPNFDKVDDKGKADQTEQAKQENPLQEMAVNTLRETKQSTGDLSGFKATSTPQEGVSKTKMLMLRKQAIIGGWNNVSKFSDDQKIAFAKQHPNEFARSVKGHEKEIIKDPNLFPQLGPKAQMNLTRELAKTKDGVIALKENASKELKGEFVLKHPKEFGRSIKNGEIFKGDESKEFFYFKGEDPKNIDSHRKALSMVWLLTSEEATEWMKDNVPGLKPQLDGLDKNMQTPAQMIANVQDVLDKQN